MAANPTGGHVWLTASEIRVTANALRVRRSVWTSERSRAGRCGLDREVDAATAVLAMLDRLTAKVERAAERSGVTLR
jgi:hypothetical protein